MSLFGTSVMSDRMDHMDRIKVSQGKVRCSECETEVATIDRGMYVVRNVRTQRMQIPSAAIKQLRRDSSASLSVASEDDAKHNEPASKHALDTTRRELEAQIVDLKEMVVALVDRLGV